jgi:glycerol kinase
MSKFILAIDQGTTGTTALLFNIQAQALEGTVNIEFKQYYPQPGWVEHDLSEIWKTTEETINQLLKNNQVSPKDIAAIGITNQRETTCAFDNQGNPLAKAIVWQDRRTAGYCQEKTESFQKLNGTQKTGLPLDPYFSATKMNWLLTNNENVKSEAKKNNLKFGTIDTFLLFKLTNQHAYFTEPTNASRTLLYNIKESKWDEELLGLFEIQPEFLPQVKNTFDEFGTTQGLSFLPDGIPITCLFGDQQSALFGQNCINPGETKCTYGTGAFILSQLGEELKYSQNKLLTTISYQHENKTHYALEGASFIAGAAVQWIRDELQIIKKASQIELLAKEAGLENCKDLFFFPFFTGIGAPHWNPHAKACLYGMTRGTNQNHIARACLEGVALSVNDLVQAMEKDCGNEIENIKVDGGMTQNNLFLSIQANFLQRNIVKPTIIESTSLGAALGALVGLKEIELNETKNIFKVDQMITPMQLDYYQDKKQQWSNVLNKIYN